MPFHHDRAASRQRGGRIAARRRKCKREIGCAEDGNRTDGTLHHHQFGPRRGLAIRQSLVVAAVEIVPLADVGCEEAKLAGGAAALSFETRGGEPGFLCADLGDIGATGFNLIGDGLQKRGPFLTRATRIDLESSFRRLNGPIDKVRSAHCKAMCWTMRRGRFECVVATGPFAGYQVLSVWGEGHRSLLQFRVSDHLAQAGSAGL